MQTIKLLTCSLFISLIYSCKAPVDIVYFQNTNNLEEVATIKAFEPIFKIDDIISVSVSASDMDTARPFNLAQGLSIGAPSQEGGTSSGVSQSPTYLIDSEGNIEFPVLGKIKISGLTRIKAKELIKDKLKTYINDPIVNVRLQNFKITVLGEVNRPGSFSINNDRITIIEALGLAGDLTIKGKRKNIIVIRENDTLKTYHKLDLTSKNIFSAPAYYLTQNDVVYVEPNPSQVKRSKTNDNTLGIIFSTISVVVTVLGFLIVQR